MDSGKDFHIAPYATPQLQQTFNGRVTDDEVLEFLWNQEEFVWEFERFSPEHRRRVFDYIKAFLSVDTVLRLLRTAQNDDQDKPMTQAALLIIASELKLSRTDMWRIVRVVMRRDRRSVRFALLCDVAALRPFLQNLGVPSAGMREAIAKVAVVFP